MERIQYTVSMTRPDRKRTVNRHIFLDHEPHVRSLRQLAGYLTHTLFGDTERGAVGTFYTITKRVGKHVRVFTVERTESGHYLHS
jgi:hypothetical protein